MGSEQKSQPSSIFDRFAEAASEFASHAVFFIACAFLVVLWVPSYFVVGSLDTWQLIINTLTTIVTFLLVALLQNSQRRNDRAVHAKLDALDHGLADLMSRLGGTRDGSGDLAGDIKDLHAAVGAERASD